MYLLFNGDRLVEASYISVRHISFLSTSRDSSVGRAEDCSGILSESSLGRWFKSGSRELVFNQSVDHTIWCFCPYHISYISIVSVSFFFVVAFEFLSWPFKASNN